MGKKTHSTIDAHLLKSIAMDPEPTPLDRYCNPVWSSPNNRRGGNITPARVIENLARLGIVPYEKRFTLSKKATYQNIESLLDQSNLCKESPEKYNHMLEFFRIQLNLKPKSKDSEKSKLRKSVSMTPGSNSRKRTKSSRVQYDQPNSSEKLIKANNEKPRHFEGKPRIRGIRKLNEDSGSENIITIETSEERQTIPQKERFETDQGDKERRDSRRRSQKTQINNNLVMTESSTNGTPESKKTKRSSRKGRIDRSSRANFEGNNEEYYAVSPEPVDHTRKNPLKKFSDPESRERNDSVYLTNSESANKKKSKILPAPLKSEEYHDFYQSPERVTQNIEVDTTNDYKRSSFKEINPEGRAIIDNFEAKDKINGNKRISEFTNLQSTNKASVDERDELKYESRTQNLNHYRSSATQTDNENYTAAAYDHGSFKANKLREYSDYEEFENVPVRSNQNIKNREDYLVVREQNRPSESKSSQTETSDSVREVGEFTTEGQKRRLEETRQISHSIGAEKPGVDKNNFKERVSESKGSGDKEKKVHVPASDLKSQNRQSIANDPTEPTREKLYAEVQQEVPTNFRNDTISSDIALLNTAQATQNNSDADSGKNLENIESRSRIESKPVQPDKLSSTEKDANLSEEINLDSLEQSKYTEEPKAFLNFDQETIRFIDHSQKIVESSEPLASRDEKRDMPSKSSDNTNDLPTRVSETQSFKTQLEDRVFEKEDVVIQPRFEIAENNSKAARAFDRFQTETSSLSRETSVRKSSTAEIQSTEKLASSNIFPNRNEETVQNSKFSDPYQDSNNFEAKVPTEARNEEYYFLTKKNNAELTHLKREHYSYNSEKIGEKNSENASINSHSYDQYATTTSKINRTVENYEIRSPTQYHDTNLLTSSGSKERVEFSETLSNQPIKRYSQKANRNEDTRQLLNERYFIQSKNLDITSENETIRGGNKLLTVSGFSERYESGYSDRIYQKMDPKYKKSELFLQSYESYEESNDLIKKEKKKSISKQRQSQKAPIAVAALIRNPSIVKLEPETSKKPRKMRNRSNSEKIRKDSRKSFKNGLDSENEKTLETSESRNLNTRSTRRSLNPLNFLSMSNIEKTKRKSSRVSIASNMEKDRKKSLKKRKTVKNQQEESEKGYESPVQIEEKRRSISKFNNRVVEYVPIDTNSEEDRVHEDDSGMLAPNNSFEKSNRNSNSPGRVFARKPLRSRPKNHRQPNESPNGDDKMNLSSFSPFGGSVFGRRFFSPDRLFTGDDSTWIGERQDPMLDEQSTRRQQDRLYIQHEDYNEFRQDEEPEPASRLNERVDIYFQSNPLFEDQDYLENKLIQNFNVSESKSQRDGDLARAKTYDFRAQEKNRYQENQNLEQLHRIQHLESAIDATERGSIREDSRGSIKQYPNTINEDLLKMENRKREVESNELENSNPRSMRITEKEEFCVGIDEGSFNQRFIEDRKASLKHFGALSAHNSRNQEKDEIKVIAEEKRIEEESAEYQTAVLNETQTDSHEQKSIEPNTENLRNTEKAEIIREGIENRASEENQLGSQSKDDPNITVHEEGFIQEANTKDIRTMDSGSERSNRLKESSNELKNGEDRARLEREVSKIMPESTEIRSKKPFFAEIRSLIRPNQQSDQQEDSETITSKAAKKTSSAEEIYYKKPETSNSSRGKKSRKATNSISKNEINAMRQIENEAAKKIQRFFRAKMLAKKARANRLKKTKILKEEPTQTEFDKRYPPLNDPSDFTKFLRLVSRTPDYQLANHLTNLYMFSQKEIAQSISKKP